jgi:hypothetical protein
MLRRHHFVRALLHFIPANILNMCANSPFMTKRINQIARSVAVELIFWFHVIIHFSARNYGFFKNSVYVLNN